MPRMLRRHRRGIGDDSLRRVLGDQVGGILGDELIALHRFDQCILAFFHARGEAIERRRQRANFAAALVAGQRRYFLAAGVVGKMSGQGHERPHRMPGQNPDRGDHDHACEQQEFDEAEDQVVDREECFVLGVHGGDDPVRRGYALVGDERLAAVRVQRLLGALEAAQCALEEGIGLRREGDGGTAASGPDA